MKQAKSTLILGGARSGKSRYAEKLAYDSSLNLIYLATAEIRDDEMRERVEHHKADRAGRWDTIEEPIEIPKVIQKHSKIDNVILIDCLTIWLSNLMEAGKNLEAGINSLVDTIKDAEGHVILVSNEVGQGIVPANALARTFRDEAGRLNQVIASAADEVISITAGLPLTLKTTSKE